MGRSNGGGEGVDPRSNGIESEIEKAAHNARMAGRIADLRVSSLQLFLQTTEQTRMALCIADPHQPDCPIVYCNQAFVDLTGYSRKEIVGRNCRFLQGSATKPSAVARLREAVEHEQYSVVDILNYRKDGTAFWNAVHVGPVYDEQGELAYFFGSQWDITELLAARETIVENERVAAELRHRTDNLFAVLTAIVRLSARNAKDTADLSEKIERRIEALAGAHRVSLAAEGLRDDRTNLRSLIEAVMQPYRNAHPDRIELSGELIELPRKHVTPMGLTLHELATNALKYGSLSDNEGKVRIDWDVKGDTLVLQWVERHEGKTKPAAAQVAKGSGTGSRLIEGVIGRLGGSVETRLEASGFRATVRVPASVRAFA